MPFVQHSVPVRHNDLEWFNAMKLFILLLVSVVMVRMINIVSSDASKLSRVRFVEQSNDEKLIKLEIEIETNRTIDNRMAVLRSARSNVMWTFDTVVLLRVCLNFGLSFLVLFTYDVGFNISIHLYLNPRKCSGNKTNGKRFRKMHRIRMSK